MLQDELSLVRVVDVHEAARLIGISSMTFQRMRARGELPPAVQLSPRRVGFRLVDLAKWLEDRRRT